MKNILTILLLVFCYGFYGQISRGNTPQDENSEQEKSNQPYESKFATKKKVANCNQDLE